MTLRDDLAQVIHERFNDARGRNGVNANLLADLILASDLIRKIRAEAWDEGFDECNGNEGYYYVGVNPYREETSDVR